MMIYLLPEYINSVDWKNIIWGFIIMVWVHILIIALNIKITQGEFGETPGRFKAYCIAAFFGVTCNAISMLTNKINKGIELWSITEIIAIVVISCKLFTLKISEDPRWYMGDECYDNSDPFSTTVSISFLL